MKNHSLITTLKNLRGNPRGVVFTEPFWGIPYNLYAPYISVYMLALGLRDQQIGLIVSFSWVLQVVMMLLSGVVTDKLGRRRTTLLFDLLAWSLPAFISAIAQNFWFFLAAGLLNSFWRITFNSWSCLLVEDADTNQLVDIFTWIYISNQLVGFAAPLAGLLIATYNLVPTMRGLYFFAGFTFAFKAFITYRLTQETQQGQVRMHETRQQSLWQILAEYKDVVKKVLQTRQTLYLTAILLVMQITWVISGNFWSIIVTQKLQIPDQALSIFPFVKSAIMLAFFFALIPLINRLPFRLPLVVGFVGYVVSQLLLVSAPVHGYLFLALNVFLEACSYATVTPLMDKLTVLAIDAKERSRILAIVYVVIILFTAPFGWIAGVLSGMDKGYPFILNTVLFAICAGLVYFIGAAIHTEEKETPASESQGFSSTVS